MHKKPSNYKIESLIPYFDNLHDLFLNTSHLPFTYLIFDRQDLDSLVQYTIQSYEESEFCCDKPTNCYLEILSIFKLEKVSQALSLFKTFKNSLENTKIIFKSVLDLPLESFKNEVKITINLLDDFFEFVYVNRNKVYDGSRVEDGSKVEDGSRVDNKVEEKDDSKVERNCNFNNNPKSPFYPSIYSILDSFFLILKKLQNDFESKIDFYLERSQSEIPLRFFGIRSFDLSKSISKEDYSETKIFACLWFILNKDFKKIEEITLEKHLEIREILELLFFIKSKIDCEGGYEGRDVKVRDDDYEVRDYKEDHNDLHNSSLFKIYFLIRNYLKVNYKDLLFPSFTPYFFRFLEENVLKDLFYLTFTFMDLEDFKNKFTKMKNKEKVIEEYFKFLEKSEVKECKVEEGVNDDHKLDDNQKDIIHLNSSLIYDLEDFTLKGISEVGESLNYGESLGERGFKGRDSRSTLNPAFNHPTLNHPTTINTLPYNTKDHIYSFSLILKSKFLKDNLVFRSLKSFIEKNLENLYDTVCIHFVSHLNSNECIILDSKLKTKCKFKNLLGKKCKDPKMGSEGSTTYI